MCIKKVDFQGLSGFAKIKKKKEQVSMTENYDNK